MARWIAAWPRRAPAARAAMRMACRPKASPRTPLAPASGDSLAKSPRRPRVATTPRRHSRTSRPTAPRSNNNVPGTLSQERLNDSRGRVTPLVTWDVPRGCMASP